MIVEFHPLAERELTEAAIFYDEQASGLGVELLNEMEHLVEILGEYPELGRSTGHAIRTLSARRFPYTIVYQPLSERLVILAIAHQRRLPKYWAARVEY